MKNFFLTLAAVLVAFAAGWTACNFTQKAAASFNEITEANDFSAQMARYRADAGLSGKTTAEHALWLQLGEQLAFRRRNNATFSADLLSVDAAYTYVRLSELAEERKDTTASVELLQYAIAVCKQSQSPNCHVEALRRLVHVIDGKEKQ